MSSLLFQGGTIVAGDRTTKDDILLRDGAIEEIDRFVEEYDAVDDISGKWVFPGLADCHVHFREPGFPEKETMKSGALAARAGGVTLCCDMPNTDPPTVTTEAFADKVRRAQSVTDGALRFFFGVREAAHLEELAHLLADDTKEGRHLRAHLCGVKIYLDHSTGNQRVDPALLDAVFAFCAAHELTLVAHCEDPEINAQSALQNTRMNIAAHSLIRPSYSEMSAIKTVLALAKTHGTHLHIAHLSTEGGVGLIRAAKAEGIAVTCEVATHHLFLSTDDYERLGALIKVNPPIRSPKHRTALWQGIKDGVIDCIVTDHAPHTLAEKNVAEPLQAPGGIPGVETMLPLLLSVAAGKWPHPAEPHVSCPPFTYEDIVRLCVVNPNRIFHLGVSEIEEDKAVDLVIVDPAKQWTIRGAELRTQCGWTPYEGWMVQGKVERVIRRKEDVGRRTKD